MNGHTQRFSFYKDKGLNFTKVLDIGAFEGHWTAMFKQLFPLSEVLMVEANFEKESNLKSLKHLGDYKIALLGAENDKEVDYYKCLDSAIATGNSIFQENTNFKFQSEKRKTQTLNFLLEKNITKEFDLIKMDVQGSELDIIKGGLDVIKNTKFLLMELQTLEYNKGAPRIENVISYLKDLDFEFIDIFDLLYSKNGHLIQLDGFFINKRFRDSKKIFNFN